MSDGSQHIEKMKYEKWVGRLATERRSGHYFCYRKLREGGLSAQTAGVQIAGLEALWRRTFLAGGTGGECGRRK